MGCMMGKLKREKKLKDTILRKLTVVITLGHILGPDSEGTFTVGITLKLGILSGGIFDECMEHMCWAGLCDGGCCGHCCHRS